MNITININSIDRTDDILWESFSLRDNIEDKVNSCRFTIRKPDSNVPEVGQSVSVYDDDDKIFAGEILTINRKIDGQMFESFECDAVDYTHDLDSLIIVEKYEEETVNDIIGDLIDTYHSDYNTDNVDCSIEIDTIAFNNVSVLGAIQKLAEVTNYRWYVDYNKSIHFYAKGSETAPFDLTDTNGKYIYKSLEITDDLSQLRNTIKIRGGEMEGDDRTEYFDGDGTKNIFGLNNKFSSAPTVSVGGTPVTVGIDYLDDESDYDCFWNFNEKYVRFKDSEIPGSGSNNIAVEGSPLIPIVVRKYDSVSINEYGTHEFYIRDNTIKSREEALQYANAQLEAYKNSIIEGSFNTYESGLESGQIINIQSDKRDIDEDFIIQSVQLKMRGPFDGVYNVKLATMRTVGIIDLLQDLLQTDRRIVLKEQEQEPLLTLIQLDDGFEMDDSMAAPIATTTEDYVWWDNASPPAGQKIVWNLFTWA